MRKSDFYVFLIVIVVFCMLVQLAISNTSCGNRNHPRAGTDAVMHVLAVAIQAYAIRCGGIHTDDNSELIKVLTVERENVGQHPFLNLQFTSLDKQGRILDGWGTPFLFHLDQTGTNMTIQSFGKNRRNDNGEKDDIKMEFGFSSVTKAAQKVGGKNLGSVP